MQNRSGHAPDAASTSLAVWLLEAMLSRAHSVHVPGTLDSLLASTPPASVSTGQKAVAALSDSPGTCSEADEAVEFVRRYYQWLPYPAVEQILLARGCQEKLKKIANKHEAWRAVFSLSLAGMNLFQIQPIYRVQAGLAGFHFDMVAKHLSNQLHYIFRPFHCCTCCSHVFVRFTGHMYYHSLTALYAPWRTAKR